MQGLPINILTQKGTPAAAASISTSSSTPTTSSGESSTAVEGKNDFAALFANLLGNKKVAIENGDQLIKNSTGNNEADGSNKNKETSKAIGNPELKLDVLLKNNNPESSIKNKAVSNGNNQALSAETLKNIDSLLSESELKKSETSTEEISTDPKEEVSLGNNLLDLLQTLQSKKIDGAQTKNEAGNEKSEMPLDFLLKKSRVKDTERDMVVAEQPSVNSDEFIFLSDKFPTLNENQEMSELVKHAEYAEYKDQKMGKGLALNPKIEPVSQNDQVFDPKVLMQKQSGQSIKAYGQKQNILNDNVIKNIKDLSNKDSKPRSTTDELQTPDLKIGANLSTIKESLIPVLQKNEAGQSAETQSSAKVLDLSKINSANTNEIIKKITDYVEQNQLVKNSSLDLTVKHDSLGQFKIQVNKSVEPGSGQVNMMITTSTSEGHDFFVKNELGLMKNLSQAGIQLSDLRIVSGGESMSFSQSDSRSSGSFTPGQQKDAHEFMSFGSGNMSGGSEKRKELWQEARANQQRYGA